MPNAKIVILGAGFAGLTAALELAKRFKRDEKVTITLIDRHDYFLFTPNLYEIASSVEELTTLSQLKKSVALPFAEVLAAKRVGFIKGEIEDVDILNKQVRLPARLVSYDYLIVATGSETEYYGITGAKEHSIGLKSLKESLLIRHSIDFLVQLHRQDKIKQTLRIVIVAGGSTGVELAGELAKSLDLLAWKNNYPRERIELEIVDAANRLLPDFDDRLSQAAAFRLQSLGVRVRLVSPIAKVERNMIELLTGERVHYDLLIWTAGIRGTHVPGLEVLAKTPKGRFLADENLRAKHQDNIFVLGDAANIIRIDGNPQTPSAWNAWDQAKYLAYVLPLLMRNQTPKKYQPDYHHNAIVNIGGKWAAMSYRGWQIKGYLAYLTDKLAHLQFYASLVGWRKAFKYVWFQSELYGRND